MEKRRLQIGVSLQVSRDKRGGKQVRFGSIQIIPDGAGRRLFLATKAQDSGGPEAVYSACREKSA